MTMTMNPAVEFQRELKARFPGGSFYYVSMAATSASSYIRATIGDNTADAASCEQVIAMFEAIFKQPVSETTKPKQRKAKA